MPRPRTGQLRCPMQHPFGRTGWEQEAQNGEQGPFPLCPATTETCSPDRLWHKASARCPSPVEEVVRGDRYWCAPIQPLSPQGQPLRCTGWLWLPVSGTNRQDRSQLSLEWQGLPKREGFLLEDFFFLNQHSLVASPNIKEGCTLHDRSPSLFQNRLPVVQSRRHFW